MRWWFFTFVALCAVSSRLPAENSKPNIIFILADDLGWGDVGFHGGDAETPHLDQLASEGVELTSHYVAPVCSPTRTGLLTGRNWTRFGVTTPTNTLAIPLTTITLPRLLAEQGYDTCLIGKWHLGSLPKWGPNHFGFNHSYGSLAGGVSPWSHGYKQGIYRPTWHRNEELIQQSGHVTDLLTGEAIDWIGQRRDRPFFMYLPYTAVHLPLKEPDLWVSRVPAAITDEVQRHYLASIMHLDDAVGRILRAVDASVLKNETLIVFTSDNGGSTAENNDRRYPDDQCPTGRLPGDNLPFRGKKGEVYEGGVRVPTTVWWPGKLSPRKESTPCCIIDWLPTLCAFAGVKVNETLKLDGEDLSEMLLDKNQVKQRGIYIAGPNWRSVAVRRGHWKLVEHRKDENRNYELYDLNRDPTERNDLAGDQPKILREMIQVLSELSRADRDSVVKEE